MNLHRLRSVILRLASLLVPADQRRGWLEEWHSELWYMRRDVALRACLGSFRDALWIRRNAEAPQKPVTHTASGCLAVVSAAGVAGLFAAKWLLDPLALRTTLWKLTPQDLLPACILTLALSVAFLPFASPSGPFTGFRGQLPRKTRARRALFLTAKLMAVQPILLCGLFSCMMAAPTIPPAPFGVIAGWYLLLRWVIADQRNRCPECLRLLDRPIRIGTRSSILLEWHGEESACPGAHGLLHVPESKMSYLARQRWLALDASWSSLTCAKPRGLRT